MRIPTLLHIDKEIYSFSDISLMYLYLTEYYGKINIKDFIRGEKILYLRKGKKPVVIWYEIDKEG